VEDGKTYRVKDTRASGAPASVERQSVTQDDTTFSQRIGEHIVGGRSGTIHGAETIRFGEDDVQGDGRGAQLAETRDKATYEIPRPGPLTDRREAVLVHVDDDDVIAGRPRIGRAHEDVVCGIVEAS
jgi:hypothetical protein